MATFWERAAHSVTICSLCIISVCNCSCFSLCFRRRDFGSDCTSSWSLLTFYFVSLQYCVLTCALVENILQLFRDKLIWKKVIEKQ